MCNRIRSIHEWSELPRDIYNGATLFNFEPNANVAPTEIVPVMLATWDNASRTAMARFGINLIGKDGRARPALLNARTDSMRRGQFRSQLKNKRCVIPAAGFYEWRDEDGKQPYFFFRKDGKPLLLAGIWDESEYKGDRRIAFAILTDEPNDLIAPYHDRMPVALSDELIAVWLDLEEEVTLDQRLILPLDEFSVRPMNRAMNNVRQKDIRKIDPEFAVRAYEITPDKL